MLVAWIVLAGEAAAAFATLDVFFRYMSVDPVLLRQRLRRYGATYAAIAAVACTVGTAAQLRSAGYAGLAPAVLNWVPWWLLWRFGLRKQFTYLFKSDGGRPLSSKKPGP